MFSIELSSYETVFSEIAGRITYETGWAPERVCTWCRTEESPPLRGIEPQFPDRPARSLDTILAHKEDRSIIAYCK